QVMGNPGQYAIAWSIVRTSAGWVAAVEAGQFSPTGTTVYRSQDAGATWAAVAGPGTGFDDAGHTVLAAANPGAAVDYALTATWRLTSNWLAQFCLPYVHADFHTATQVRIGHEDATVFGTDGGLAITRDGGATFDTLKNTGLVDQLTYQVTVDPRQPDYVLST